MAHTIHTRTEVKLPQVPNFLICENGDKLHIADVQDDDLRAIGEAWTVELLATAEKRRAARAAEGHTDA